MNRRHTAFEEDELHAYADGVLPDYRREAVERLLRENWQAAVRVDDYLSLNRLMRDRYDPVLAESTPVRLRGMPTGAKPRWLLAPAANWPRFAALAATLTLGVGIGFGFGMPTNPAGDAAGLASGAGNPAVRGVRYSGTDSTDRFVRSAALAHVVYMPEFPARKGVGGMRNTDFVKWLTGRMGVDVRPPDLQRSGFELAGGRLLPEADGSMAQLMYRNAQGERVTLCISRRKADTNRTAFKLYEDGPVKVFYWIDGQYGYAVSGGIDRATLLRLSRDVYEQFTAVSG